MNAHRTIVVLGLDNSHPYVDASHLRLLDPSTRFVLVRGEQPDRERRFLHEQPDTVITGDLDSALAMAPNGLLVTLRPSRLVGVVAKLAVSGIATFINKPGVATQVQLRESLQHLTSPQARFMSASVLRFAPKIQRLTVDRDAVQSVSAYVGHGIGHWQMPGNEWQADRFDGGGIVGSLGYHGLELLDAVVGPGLTVTRVMDGAHGSDEDRGHRYVYGEWPDGTQAQIHLDATASRERYQIELAGDHDLGSAVVDSDDHDGFGYRATMAAFGRFIEGDVVLPWSRSLSVLQSAALAHGLDELRAERQ